MNEHIKRLNQVANLLDETQNGMAAVGVDKAVEYLASLEQRLAAAEQRATDAEAWKESMLSVMPPMQEIGNELGVLLGDSIHDKILSGIKTLKAQLAIFKPCVELYANTRNWGTSKTGCDQWVLTTHGCAPAQAALARVDGMAGEGRSMASDIGHAEGQM